MSTDIYLDISDNGSLTSLDGLSNLTTLDGDLEISYNPALTTLDGLSSLTTVDGEMYIHNNECLNQAEAEAFAAGLSAGGAVDVFNNGANYPCN